MSIIRIDSYRNQISSCELADTILDISSRPHDGRHFSSSKELITVKSKKINEWIGEIMLFRNLKNSVLSLGKSLDSPVFLKEFEDMDQTIQALEELKGKTRDSEIINNIEMDQLYIRLGAQGEKNVNYELKNSFLPMYILHDVRIQQDDYSAQLDFVIITSKFICILETKKLNGDVNINNQGDFTRSFKSSNGKTYKKEGIYSPISQNQRHVRILHDMLVKNKLIKYAPVLSLVVMANPKSIIDYKFAPKEIKDQIIKYDQLTPYLKKMISKTSDINMPIVTMNEIAEFLLEQHVEKENTFVSKYEKLIFGDIKKDLSKIAKDEITADTKIEVEAVVEAKIESKVEVISNTKIDVIREKLITYRKQQSKIENVAAYLIYNNNQMEDILSKMPKDKSGLNSCSGFGPVKTEKYGDEILKIING